MTKHNEEGGWGRIPLEIGVPTARKERKGLEIEKGGFRWREMRPIWGLKSRKGRKFSKLKRGWGRIYIRATLYVTVNIGKSW